MSKAKRGKSQVAQPLEKKSKEATKQSEDMVVKRLTALASLLTAITAFIGGVILAWPRPNAFFPAVPSPTLPTSNTTPLNPSSIPALTPPQTTKPPAYAAVQSFTIMKGGKVLNTVQPKGTISMKGGGSNVIRVKLLTNDTPEVLSFYWSTCLHGNIIEGQGAFEIPYDTPQVVGSDCIEVRIRKDDVLLEVSFIFVTIQ
jgi:hypothetical protein